MMRTPHLGCLRRHLLRRCTAAEPRSYLLCKGAFSASMLAAAARQIELAWHAVRTALFSLRRWCPRRLRLTRCLTSVSSPNSGDKLRRTSGHVVR